MYYETKVKAEKDDKGGGGGILKFRKAANTEILMKTIIIPQYYLQ